MQQAALPTEVIAIHSQRSLGKVYLDWTPQPGNFLELDGEAYTILERRHRYQLRHGCYLLYKMVVYVQLSPQALEKTLIDGRWIVGDAGCKYNALSEVIRCAVNPIGPCEGCNSREPRN